MLTLPVRLIATAARLGDAPAIIAGDRAVGWSWLRDAAAAVRQALAAADVRPGDRVAVLAENSPEAAAAFYGVLGAGAVLLTLNAAAKAPELARVVRHAEARALLHDPAHPESAALLAALAEGPPVAVRTLADAAATPAPWPEPVPRAGDDPAALVYTSGTTGAPKGVLLSHGNYAANTDAILETAPVGPADRTLCLLPFHYAYGASVLHTHVSAGATLLLENSLVFPQRVLARAAAAGVTCIPGVPSTFALLLRRGGLSSFDLSSVRTVLQAGGALAPHLADELQAALPQARVHIMYGQTEATARLTCLPPEARAERRGSCGRAIPGVTLRIVDPETQADCTVGQVGEVHARGPNVMLGYWRDPEATERALRGGWLHTGDFGRLDADGYLTLEGRRGDMIKTGAHRVSPFEIEEAVVALPFVEEAIAVGAPDELLGQVVHVFVTVRAGADFDPLAVQRHCREVLASHKIPKVVRAVPAFPRTPSGKVQRDRLLET